ncbi:MAG: argininosuccinate synthase domain-containing protein, partial [Phycisphaerales bacterium]
MPRVLLAMSGGVDSSVAAALLQRAGHDVVGVCMRLGSPGESCDELERADACPAARPGAAVELRIGHQGCCSINDAADARLVADPQLDRGTRARGRAGVGALELVEGLPRAPK